MNWKTSMEDTQEEKMKTGMRYNVSLWGYSKC